RPSHQGRADRHLHTVVREAAAHDLRAHSNGGRGSLTHRGYRGDRGLSPSSAQGHDRADHWQRRVDTRLAEGWRPLDGVAHASVVAAYARFDSLRSVFTLTPSRTRRGVCLAQPPHVHHPFPHAHHRFHHALHGPPVLLLPHVRPRRIPVRLRHRRHLRRRAD